MDNKELRETPLKSFLGKTGTVGIAGGAYLVSPKIYESLLESSKIPLFEFTQEEPKIGVWSKIKSLLSRIRWKVFPYHIISEEEYDRMLEY